MSFPRSTCLLIGQLRRSLDAGGLTIPCRYVSNLQPAHACKHKEACLRPISSCRSVARLTARTSLCLISPYCPSLALNRMELPEGSSCRHSDPIRYFVREAPHPVISATVARSRRELAGTCQVIKLDINLITYKHATSCRNQRCASAVRAFMRVRLQAPCWAGFIDTYTAIATRQTDQCSVRTASRVPVPGGNANASFRAFVAST